MRKLGLIGGTGPESTVIYYRALTSGVQRRLGQSVFPHLSIESLSVFEVLEYCRQNDHAGLAAYLTSGIADLAAAGAEFAAFTGITPHIVFDEVARRSPIPLVSMVEASCAYAVALGYRRLALLGTLPTMNGAFFQRPFLEAGIEVLTPNEAEKAFIGEKIETELEYGIVKPQTQEGFKRIAARLLEEEKADTVVLGCTELPLVFDGIELPFETMDTMKVHIDALIERIVRD